MTEKEAAADADAVGGHQTAAQLRADIDSGRTRDKVAHSDPAAAPLGTDDEAAGTPPSERQVAAARRQETGRSVDTPAPADRPQQAGTPAGGRFLWPIIAAIAVLVVMGISLSL